MKKLISLQEMQIGSKDLARYLLGKVLVKTSSDGARLSGRIVETEAYLGAKDKAAHSYMNRRTQRTEVMFKSGGRAYVYFIYGMHHCFNIVASVEGDPQAVLIRAIEPLEGLSEMMKNRKTEIQNKLCSGPGKICSAFGLDRSHNGLVLNTPSLFIEDWQDCSEKIHSDKRINVDYAEEAAHWRLRFFLMGRFRPYLSRFPLQEKTQSRKK